MSPADGAVAADYDRDKRDAAAADPSVRARLAARRDAQPEILYFLAGDSATEVRREIARNRATPHQADVILSVDRDETVRADLAVKLALLLPGMAEDARAQVRERAAALVEALARDKAALVRQAVAEALKDASDAPHGIVQALARDVEIDVARPILRFSPLLTDADLIEIVAISQADGAAEAVAERRGVSESVSAAIAEQGDERAVAALLANGSAQIREDTLDAIVERAPDRAAWHGPLVERPRLPGRLARKIAAFVASVFLERLAARADLDEATRRSVAEEVKRRVEPEADAAAAAAAEDDGEAIAAKVRALAEAGRLGDDEIDEALDRGDRRFVFAALATLGKLPGDTVAKIVASRSAKGVTALAWKAGLGPRMAGTLQVRLAGIPPHQKLNPRDGAYPMTEDEMTWHLELHGA